MKSIIFHFPLPLVQKYFSGSTVRPQKMYQAFLELGYEVDLVCGYVRERKKAIREIISQIEKGKKYQFCYSESSTMPTVLTEKHHFPTHPFLDFHFFKKLKRENISIGLFYRDIHWKFKQYKENVPFLKRSFAIAFYHYDLFWYRKLLDVLFLPSPSMKKYLPEIQDKVRTEPLPPGCEIKNTSLALPSRKTLNLIYVGGVLPPLYDLTPLFKAINDLSQIKLTLICRSQEWEKAKNIYALKNISNLQILHVQGEEISHYYNEADLFMMTLKPYEYLKFAMPVKIFEALGYALPIVTFEGTEAAQFIEKEKIGWIVKNIEELRKLLVHLLQNREKIYELRKKIEKVREKHTWKARAQKVANLLSKNGDPL